MESQMNSGGGGFRAKMKHYLCRGEKKHVITSMVTIGVIFMNRFISWSAFRGGKGTYAGFKMMFRGCRRGQAYGTTNIASKRNDGSHCNDFDENGM